MPTPTGQPGTLTLRDQEILNDLFFCRYLSTAQIAALHFGSLSRARTRLYELQKKGYIVGRVIYTIARTAKAVGKQETVWHLSKDGFDMASGELDSEQGWISKPLGPEKTRDHIRVSEVYVQAKELLDEVLGPYPQWQWFHEKRAYDEYQLGGQSYKHRPDAHVIFRDNLFVIERQTKESKVTTQEVYGKVASTRTYIKAQRIEGIEQTDLLFACDDNRVAEASERAGKQYGVYVVGSSPDQIAHYLYQSATRLR